MPAMRPHKHKVGERIRNFEILEQIRIKEKNRTTKGYKCLCLTYNEEFIMPENAITRGFSSPYASNQRVCLGNCLATNRPDMHELMVDKELGYNVTPSSGVKTVFKCSKCGSEKECRIDSVYANGFKCNICSKGTSYSELLMMSILISNNIKFTKEKMFKDLKSIKDYPLRFDFYLPDYNILIEMQGEQHFKASGWNSDTKNLYYNDIMKTKFCTENKIELVAIDSSVSDYNYIVGNINSSIILRKLNLKLNKEDIINIMEKQKYNNYREISDLYTYTNMTETEIGKLLEIPRHQVNRMVSKFGLEKKIITPLKGKKKKVRCITNNMIYESVAEAGRQTHCNATKIALCCKGKIDKVKVSHKEIYLKWEYYKEEEAS